MPAVFGLLALYFIASCVGVGILNSRTGKRSLWNLLDLAIGLGFGWLAWSTR